MKCRFMPGDRVVCVNASISLHPALLPIVPSERLTEGAIYTVADVRLIRAKGLGEHVILILRERPRRGANPGYHHERFRPARDIEQFREIVANAPRSRQAVDA